jgi:hypothetical protein
MGVGMSRFVGLPRSVLCPEGHPIPYPRIRPGEDGEGEVVVGTCVPCQAFYFDLTRRTDLLAPYDLSAAHVRAYTHGEAEA